MRLTLTFLTNVIKVPVWDMMQGFTVYFCDLG